jgi:uncharacterized protein (DUF433 family)
MSQFSQRITVSADLCHGKPCIRGLRYPVEMIIELMSSGMSSESILSDYPDLEQTIFSHVLSLRQR